MAGEIVAGYLFSIMIVTSICLNAPDGRWGALAIVDALEGGAACKGIFSDEADCLWEINLAEIGGALEGSFIILSPYSSLGRLGNGFLLILILFTVFCY